jgi:peptide/nickel transport system ATP-binding protein
MTNAAISVDKLNVSFGDSHVVKDLSFDVRRGESYGLVGESGSGKSTVLRVLSGLNRDWSGTVTIEGAVQPKIRDKAFYRNVQMVFQDPYGSLHPKKTVDDTLAEPLAIHGLDKAEARIGKALSDVGLPASFRFRYPHQLSGGQRQRVAIARALVLEPSILLLDEPTSALDVSIQAEVLNLLAALRQERKLTYILVSHDLSVVGHMCERLLVMQFGRAVEEMTVETLAGRQPQTAYAQQLLTASAGFRRTG